MGLEPRIEDVPPTVDNAAPNDPSVLQRECAATRVAHDVRVVCRTGWTAPVHQLSGATRVVWEALDQPQTAADLARSVGIDAVDEYFLQALELLIEADLIRRTPL